MTKLEKQRIIDSLEDVLKTSRMETCHFGQDTEEIKARVSLWMESWITTPLGMAIQRLKEAK